MIDIRTLLTSFKHAIRGVVHVFKTEQSFRLQSIAAMFAIAMALILEVGKLEFILILLLSVAVLTLELVNSVFERLVDAFKPRIHPIVRDVKDIMAGTVFLAALCAAVVGMIIFIPRISVLFFSVQGV